MEIKIDKEKNRQFVLNLMKTDGLELSAAVVEFCDLNHIKYKEIRNHFDTQFMLQIKKTLTPYRKNYVKRNPMFVGFIKKT